MTVHQLRQLWKPTKQQLLDETPNHPTSIRLHRAFSWLQRMETCGEEETDLALLCLWIAFNALYGEWNPERAEPFPDAEGWRRFLERVMDLDHDNRLATMLTEQRPLVMELFEDAYLTRFFWEDPSEMRAGKAKKTMYEARTWYLERRHALILQRVVERIYLLRCQLAHGAATFGGRLNRRALERCVPMLRHLLIAVLRILIDHGAREDWGVMCYPPRDDADGA